MKKAEEERMKNLKRIKYMNYFMLVPIVAIPSTLILFFWVISRLNFEIQEFLFLTVPVLSICVIAFIFIIYHLKKEKIFYEKFRISVEDKNGWFEQNTAHDYTKEIFYITKLGLSLFIIVSISWRTIAYFVYGISFEYIGMIVYPFLLIFFILMEFLLLKPIMKKFDDYHGKNLIEVDCLKAIATIEKLFSENKIPFKKLGKGKIFYFQKYDELFCLENGLNIYITNIPKTLGQKQQTNILIGKITTSNQFLAELIKSDLDKLEE